MKLIAVMIALVILLCPVAVFTQDPGDLIINPKLMGGVGGLPFVGPKIVKIDSTNPPKKTGSVTRQKEYYFPTKPTRPSGLLITGMVPDATRRWVVAVTHNEEEFQSKFPEYLRLLSEGKRREAARVLFISRHVGVATKVENFWGGVKTRDMPEKVGSFFLELYMSEFDAFGGCLTFLSYVPREGDDIVDYGYGLENRVHGVLMIEEHKGEGDEKAEYTMQIIKARITD